MAKSKLTTLPLAELVEDMDLYPRHAVDQVHVQSLVLALQAGVQLPPLVVDAKSKRITDGWHRGRAYLRMLGPTGTVDVELVSYRNEKAMFEDAVLRNAAHGRRLDRIDQTRAVIMLEHHGVNAARIAVILNMPVERISKLRVKIAVTKSANTDNVPGTRAIVLKRPVHHMEGETLTKEQAQVHGMLPGTSFLLVARQLTQALRVGMVNMEDEKLVAQLGELRGALNELMT